MENKFSSSKIKLFLIVTLFLLVGLVGYFWGSAGINKKNYLKNTQKYANNKSISTINSNKEKKQKEEIKPLTENFIDFVIEAYKKEFPATYNFDYIKESIKNKNLIVSEVMKNDYKKSKSAIVIKFKTHYPHGIIIVDTEKKTVDNQVIIRGDLNHIYLSDIKWKNGDSLFYNIVTADEGGVKKEPNILSVKKKETVEADGDLSHRAEKLLEKDAKIIETEVVENKPNRALVLWMINPKKYPKKGEIYTCPEITRGSYYKGPTRVSLFNLENNTIINTIDLKNWQNKDELDIPYKIRDDVGPYYVRKSKIKEEGVPEIMKLKDYNGDGERSEFALFDSLACFDPDSTLIGYSKQQDKVIQYNINLNKTIIHEKTGKREKYKLTLKWINGLFYNTKDQAKSGHWEYQEDTSGRGGCIDDYKIDYNKENESFYGELIRYNCAETLK